MMIFLVHSSAFDRKTFNMPRFNQQIISVSYRIKIQVRLFKSIQIFFMLFFFYIFDCTIFFFFFYQSSDLNRLDPTEMSGSATLDFFYNTQIHNNTRADWNGQQDSHRPVRSHSQPPVGNKAVSGRPKPVFRIREKILRIRKRILPKNNIPDPDPA